MNADLKDKSEISVVLGFFAVLAIIGVIGAGFIVNDYSKARASTAWPVVEGVVLSNRPGEGTGLRYVYSVDGRTYEAKRQRFFVARFSSGSGRIYQPGEAIAVYVSPSDASTSVLQPGGSGLAFVLFSVLSGLGVFTGVGGIVRTLTVTARDTVDAQNGTQPYQVAE